MKCINKELEVFNMKELEELEDIVCLGSGGTLSCCKGQPKDTTQTEEIGKVVEELAAQP